MMNVRFTLNGRPVEAVVEPDETLADTLRNQFGLTGLKVGCGSGDCGSCTVLVNGDAVRSCILLTCMIAGRRIVTIEGLSEDGELHPIQQAFIDTGAVQCGYCIPGMVLVAKALLDGNPHPTEADIRMALSGNLCRCTGYTKIVDAVLLAADRIGEPR